MSKLAIVYWSGTGNTEAMAAAVADGARKAGAEVSLMTVSDFDPALLSSLDAIAFGCPAMGAEELEDGEFAPVFSACEPSLNGKSIALFGSYGWGDGEWMRTWEQECRTAHIALCCESVICCEAPGDIELEACRELGRELAK